ncbi:hypothetical protein E2C00_24280 [Streptomyces sp. WAC05374]|uniref:DUF6882 domain-containing protein n=1 Tax=Streptomyces sp. WAC05374 TaxID=2487420 RepID=UPI000F88A2A7|nr:DUF6882 domain-containing protein [Streptomyces sp. WAC05374]RST08027.1 hypothetical protein EF905_31020 [Streptomyces sp. WAC05374]TDF42711.1 hypothetical protein E2B92_22645 [Streptomyces sp. WAC05374]TDF51270.1 hypothetical protein E2C02_25140 [Streptomyces sp. WAC05374]TDF52583.1 hypothetical protein E2C00_24280 [Streptomyces sp. WAC05374]
MITSFSDAFVRATEPHAAWGWEQLEVFTAFMPSGPWTADLGRCLYQQGGRDLRISVLGTFDESDGSWLWGWANPGFGDMPVVGASAEVRRRGERAGVPEFTEAGLDLSAFPDPRMAVERLAFGAMGVLAAAGYLGVEAAPGTRLYLVPDDPSVPRTAPDAVTLPRVLLTGAGAVEGAVPRAVVGGYFAHHGLAQRPSPDAIGADLPNGAPVTVSFDEAGRIASVNVTAL